ncbi:MAG: hypothetical protein ACR2N7_05750 [Acidimicrobiia bacterium]
MRLRRRISLLLAIAILSVAGSAVAASANMDRYQYVDYELNISEVNGNSAYWHDFSVHYDPDLESYSGSGVYSGGSETPSGFVVADDSISFRSDYDTAVYTWYPSFLLNNDGTLTFVDGFGADNVDAAEGTYAVTESEYKNHGQYVRESEDKQAAARSLIGMPTNSKKNK